MMVLDAILKICLIAVLSMFILMGAVLTACVIYSIIDTMRKGKKE